MNESAVAVLIYNNECAYCFVVASMLKRLDNVEAISRYDNVAQAFLDVQFANVPFATVPVDCREDRMRVDHAAAKELTDRAGIPGLLGSLARDNYDGVTKVVGVASGRGRDPGDVHSVYDLESDIADLSAFPLDNIEPRLAELSWSGRRIPTDDRTKPLHRRYADDILPQPRRPRHR